MALELTQPTSGGRHRLRVAIRGAVQGVGFRPFVFRLAKELGLQGWVSNSPQGVFIEVEGGRGTLKDFLLRLEAEKPPRSFIHSLEPSWLDEVGYTDFQIRQSETKGKKSALILPDIATCPECVAEIFNPGNRRYFYPFTNCTNCGPRFSIINALPYDRANTSMHGFTMCASCQAEYDNPMDRRFHAQPNACPACGPHLELWEPKGKLIGGSPTGTKEVLEFTAEALEKGKIIALKGLGGFQLLVAAHQENAIRRLRQLKHREEKPFALMVPSLSAIESICAVSPAERRLLSSPEAPIVLVPRTGNGAEPNRVSALVAPGNPYLGVMLPYTPLHHLLLSILGMPVIATSGNLKDEPICIDEREALGRLGAMADLFLVHNRPIVRHVDDSIVRIIADREMVVRRSRGYAPLPIALPKALTSPTPVLAVGAHLKNTVALSTGSQVFISQHIGDLETEEAYSAFQRTISDFERLFETEPSVVAADAHPDYLSTAYARGLTEARKDHRPEDTSSAGRPKPELLTVQHHVAHVLACMAENEVAPPVLGVSWDGTGYGLDGTVWGGEFFLIGDGRWDRVAHLRPFPLPGGEKAVREPRRTAIGLLFEFLGDRAFELDLALRRAFSVAELRSLKTMLGRHLNSPLTSSAGRLFDAVASLVDLHQRVRFEGQAAMALEFSIREIQTEAYYPLVLRTAPRADTKVTSGERSASVLDWSDMVRAVLEDVEKHVSTGEISSRFHNGLVEGILAVARHIGQRGVVLTGGCFQNRYLAERAIHRLQKEGFRPYWHQRVPPNDGGICLGQVMAALHHFSASNQLPPQR